MSNVNISRRSFLCSAAGAAGALLLAPLAGCAAETKDPILINHVGFAPKAAKIALLRGPVSGAFTVVDTADGQIVHRGTLQPRGGDLGHWSMADFSTLEKPGRYQLVVGNVRSATFDISADIYQPAIEAAVRYFAIQRCGDSKTGYAGPCHLDDGVRRDNHQRRDVTGGWHDACDVRKWVTATIYGMIGLSRTLAVLGPQRLNRDRIVDEMRWGNQYFLKMQEPDGYVMDWCGGDDGNDFTDNRPGTADDRLITVDPAEVPAQFNFVRAQAAMASLTRADDPAYAAACEAAGERCLHWCREWRNPQTATSLAAGVLASCAMAELRGEGQPSQTSIEYARRLLALLVTKDNSDPAIIGHFRERPDDDQPSRQIMHGNLPLQALGALLRQFPAHELAPTWRSALRLHADHLLAMADRSAFETIPFGLYAGQDPGGGRRIGRYWYRYFMKPHGETKAADWWVGINAHLASNGVGLMEAATLLEDPRLARLAQRQLDWILGVNPFNASTITAIGRNQPRLFVTSEFKPPTPLIPGGVMNGIGGDERDQPQLASGSYHTCEYWTPMVAYAMWLMAHLQA